MPNRLKIDLNFNGAMALGKNVTQQGTLTAKWLFGADAQNLKAKVDAQLYRKNTTRLIIIVTMNLIILYQLFHLNPKPFLMVV